MCADSANRLAVLAIGGSDSGGGAGIQADLKTFFTLGVWGTCVITGVTAQNLQQVTLVHPLPQKVVQAQLETVFSGFPIQGVKIGMVGTKELARLLRDFFSSRSLPLVIDPVVQASTKDALGSVTVKELAEILFPLATLVTPNLLEASSLLGRNIQSLREMKEAAKAIGERFGTAVLLKGGHLKRKQLVDILWHRGEFFTFSHPRFSSSFHGTGCILSSAIATYLAKQIPLEEAVEKAIRFLQKEFSSKRFFYSP